jgi:hypothetical protein
LPTALGALVRAPPAFAVGRLLTRERLHPRPDARIAAGDAEQAPTGFVDDLELELVLHDPEPIERELLRLVDRASGDLNPVHASALSLLLLAAGVR